MGLVLTHGGGFFEGHDGGISVCAPTVANIGLLPSKYLRVLQQLLPPGRAWTRDEDTNLTALLEALSYEPGRVDARAEQLLLEALPNTAVELLPEWLAALGLADDTSLTTVAEQQAACSAQFAATGGASIPFWTALALTPGYTITITTYPQTGCNHPCNLPLSVNYQWLVTTPHGANDAFLQALFNKFAQCHTQPLFNFT